MVVVFAFALAGIASTETNWALLTVDGTDVAKFGWKGWCMTIGASEFCDSYTDNEVKRAGNDTLTFTVCATVASVIVALLTHFNKRITAAIAATVLAVLFALAWVLLYVTLRNEAPSIAPGVRNDDVELGAVGWIAVAGMAISILVATVLVAAIAFNHT